MGLLLSSCAPNLHSKILYLTENYKDFEISSSSSPSWIKKINNNLEPDSKNFNKNNTYENYWKSNKFGNFSTNLNENDLSNKSIRPKTMPRYNFESLKHEIFANEISQNPINMSVVLMHSILLDGNNSEKNYLPLGTVLNVIYKEENWLYVQTADGHEGYIDYKTCIPMGILSLPSTKENPNFVSKITNDVNIIATEKIINMNNFNNSKLQCTERDFDLMYLQLTRNLSKDYDKDINKVPLQNNNLVEQKMVIFIIKTDYVSKAKDTLNVKKGDIVFLIHCCVKGWFWVRNEHNMEGFIPAATAGYWCV